MYLLYNFSKHLNTADFTYNLPPEKIAFYPLDQRDASKLLVYEKGSILHRTFREIDEALPAGSFLFFNNTKVIPARLHFQKASGATIEVFLLNPVEPSPLLSVTMAARHGCTWQCTIGNLKKWPSDTTLQKTTSGGELFARLIDRNTGLVTLSWPEDKSFAEMIRFAGQTPLPPYIKRAPEVTDSDRYQTVYSRADGAVAAPTAGLHFTPAVFESLKQKKIGHDFLTLHVSAGTFQPIKTDNPLEHHMHEEQVVVSQSNLANVLGNLGSIIAVGTTSMRTLESIYWYGTKLLQNPKAEFVITQDDPYTDLDRPSPEDAVRAVLKKMEAENSDLITGETSIYIRPGYRFRVCRGLITNFHQPASTLILLVAAFVGDNWRKIYDEALTRDYRFLSYGDSSLLLP